MTKPTCKVRILDDVFTVLVGLRPDHINFFYNKYAVYAPNHFFNPKFKLGQWDGKIRYFQQTGKTYTYLLDEIVPELFKLGYNVALDDQRQVAPSPQLIGPNEFAHVNHPDTGQPIILRDYQYNGVNELITHGSGLLIAATGAGKTLICAALVNAYGKIGVKTLTIVPSQDLITNTKADYINCGLDTGEYSGIRKDLNHCHVVSTWQSLKNNPSVVQSFGLVLVDECHGAKGNVLQQILSTHAGNIPYRFGVTGTLPKEEANALSVKVNLGPVRGTVTAEELMKRGVLAQLRINVTQLEENLQREYQELCDQIRPPDIAPQYKVFKKQYFPDFDAEKSYIHRKQSRIEWIADRVIRKRDEKGNVLCFVDSIAFGRKLAALIPGAIFVNGTDLKKSADRQKIYDEFKTRNDLIVIATVHIASTGINIRRIFSLFLLDIGKSFTRVIQSIGRSLRTAHDKTSVEVEGICSDLEYGTRHLKTRLAYYDEAKYTYVKAKIQYE